MTMTMMVILKFARMGPICLDLTCALVAVLTDNRSGIFTAPYHTSRIKTNSSLITPKVSVLFCLVQADAMLILTQSLLFRQNNNNDNNSRKNSRCCDRVQHCYQWALRYKLTEIKE